MNKKKISKADANKIIKEAEILIRSRRFVNKKILASLEAKKYDFSALYKKLKIELVKNRKSSKKLLKLLGKNNVQK